LSRSKKEFGQRGTYLRKLKVEENLQKHAGKRFVFKKTKTIRRLSGIRKFWTSYKAGQPLKVKKINLEVYRIELKPVMSGI
jgi:hypothetical protein